VKCCPLYPPFFLNPFLLHTPFSPSVLPFWRGWPWIDRYFWGYLPLVICFFGSFFRTFLPPHINHSHSPSSRRPQNLLLGFPPSISVFPTSFSLNFINYFTFLPISWRVLDFFHLRPSVTTSWHFFTSALFFCRGCTPLPMRDIPSHVMCTSLPTVEKPLAPPAIVRICGTLLTCFLADEERVFHFHQSLFFTSAPVPLEMLIASHFTAPLHLLRPPQKDSRMPVSFASNLSS